MRMLDTNICIHVIRRRPQKVLDRLTALDINDVCVSVITMAELEFGAEKSVRPAENQDALLRFLAPLTILPFDANAAAAYGRVRAQIERAGTPIGPMDLLIAAHALAVGAIVVTNNEREFRRVDRLVVENWV